MGCFNNTNKVAEEEIKLKEVRWKKRRISSPPCSHCKQMFNSTTSYKKFGQDISVHLQYTVINVDKNLALSYSVGCCTDVTATWTPRPYLCYSPAVYDSEYPSLSLSPGQLARAGSQTPTQALNMPRRSNLTPRGTISPRPGSPLEDEDMLKEALVAARNVMEDPKPIHPMMSVSGSSIQSASDCRSASRNLQESVNEIGVASGLQWEEDSFYGFDSPRSNYSSHQVGIVEANLLVEKST